MSTNPVNKIDKKSIGIVVALGVILLIVGFFGSIVGFVTDLAWFNEVGYTDTFYTMVFAKLIVGVPIFVIVFGFLSIYLRSVRKKYFKTLEIEDDENGSKISKRLVTLAAAIISILFAFSIASIFWMDILKFFNSTAFGVMDPIFGKDISFYVFQLSLINNLFALALNLLVALIIITIAYLVILMSQNPPVSREYYEEENIRSMYPGMKSTEAKDKLIELGLDFIIKIGVVFFVILAVQNILSTYELLYSARGAIFGAGYTDVNVSLWVLRIKAVVCLVVAVALLFGRKSANKKKFVIGGISALVITTVLGVGAEVAVQNFIVAPDELSKERPYIENTIEYTNMAYGLNNVDVRDFGVEQNLTVEDILNNPDTITNISLNDYKPTLEAFNQLQGLRGYYNFYDVDIDRYVLDGKLTQVFLSVRELDKSKLDQTAQTWVNTRLKYTHGYGVTMAPANKLNPSGQPNMIMKNVPVIADYPELQLDRPQIYFGELTNDSVVVNTNETEFDYPKGETNETTAYEGTAGIELSLINRILFAIKENDINLLISGSISSDSKILINRNVKDRVEKIAPFIHFDDDPYAIIANGRVYYMIDGYTMTSYYPYAQPFNSQPRLNYIRNSVKAVVDAYDGTVNFYIADEEEPIIQTYAKIFPELFKPISEMPENLKSHIKYPQFIFDIQTNMYATFHAKDPNVFYNREDQWDIPIETYQGETQKMESLYFTLKLPGEEEAEFVLSIPYTPKEKQNMTAFMVARNDGENYGDIILYKFPKDKSVLGPEQMEARISNNDVISKELSLWDTRGSQVLRGHILTIPIEDSILYVEPLYIRADSEKAIPEVKRIIVGYNDLVVMEESLDKALEKIFGKSTNPDQMLAGSVVDENGNPVSSGTGSTTGTGSTGTVTPPSTGGASPSDPIAYANQLFNEAQEALRNGSLSEYQAKVDEIGKVLQGIN